MSAQGKLDGWRLTMSGYQMTKIDGITYKTLWDVHDFEPGSFRPGALVEFEIPSQSNVSGDPYPSVPYAKILRVVKKSAT